MVGLVGGLFIALVLLGLYYPGSGADQVHWRPTRSIEVEVQNEIDDLDQMLEAANERRRRRGAAELTEEGVRAVVADDLREQAEIREAYLVEQDIAQMLAVKNERRRRKGLPELTEAEFRASLEAPDESS
jgi:hypothetical protein